MITPGKENRKHRLKAGLSDLLRELGYRPRSFYVPSPEDELPPELDIMAFWMIRLNARNRYENAVTLPLLVDVPFDDPHLQVWLPGKIGAAFYPSLYEGIIAAAGFMGGCIEASDVIRFLRDVMRKRKGNRPALLLLVEQNLRSIFPELDVQQASDWLSLEGILDEQPQIRVARLRYSKDFEAPMCIPPIKYAKYNGLYHNIALPNVFMSLHDVNDIHINMSDRRLDKTRKNAVNPSTMQIWLNNLQRDDIPLEWANLVHRLRQGSWHVGGATLLPQPLHDVVRSLEKYLSRLADDSTDDDLNPDE